MTLAGIERTLLAALLAWLGAWAVRPARPGWRWTQHAGLALVLYPFLRLGIGAVLAAPLLLRDTVARPLTHAELVSNVTRPLVRNVLLPAAGTLLATRNVPGLDRPAREVRAALADAWAGADLGPLDRTWEGALAGLALLGPLAVAFAGALAFRGSALGQLLVTGDESQVFRNVTVPLAVGLSVAPALGEELLFRGLLLARLRRAWGPALAIAGQAAFFGLIHAGYGTLAHVVGPATFGLALGWVALRMGLGAAVVLHAEANLLFFAAELAGDPLRAGLLLVPLALLSAWALLRVGLAPFRELLGSGPARGVGAPARLRPPEP